MSATKQPLFEKHVGDLESGIQPGFILSQRGRLSVPMKGDLNYALLKVLEVDADTLAHSDLDISTRERLENGMHQFSVNLDGPCELWFDDVDTVLEDSSIVSMAAGIAFSAMESVDGYIDYKAANEALARAGFDTEKIRVVDLDRN